MIICYTVRVVYIFAKGNRSQFVISVFTGRGVFTITSQPKGSYVCFYSGKRVRIEPQCDDDSYLFELKNGSRKIWYVNLCFMPFL